MLRATGIDVWLGSRQVLHQAHLRAEAGKLTAIVGPNGSGKTTLLKALTGDVEHSGTVSLNGADIATLRGWELAARRAVLPQAATLAFPFTVAEVVRMGLAAGTSGADASVPAQALDAVGLGHLAHRLYQELSGGEQQRAQLARVLCQVWRPVEAGEPRWLLLDEPVASLDIAHQLLVMGLARDYVRRGGGVVAVMHDLNLTAMFADVVTIMAQGRVLASGPTRDVLTDATLSRAYGCAVRVNVAPPSGGTFVLPHAVTVSGHVPAPGTCPA